VLMRRIRRRCVISAEIRHEHRQQYAESTGCQ